MLALVTSLRETLPPNQRLLRPIRLSLALKGHSPGSSRCLPNSFQTSSSWGRRAQTPSPTPHFSPVGDKAWGSPTPQILLQFPHFPKLGDSAGTLLWTTFSLSAGRATRLRSACGWTTRRTTSTRGELGWLGGERKGKDMLLSVMWGAYFWCGRLTFLFSVMRVSTACQRGRGSPHRKLLFELNLD